MIIEKICIVGGTGFVGRTLANRLARDGFALRVLTRDRETHKGGLILLPKLDLVETDVHDERRLTEQFSGCDAVINLAGILNERGRKDADFNSVHIALTEKITAACRAQGIKRLLHMSALNADTNAPSKYLRSKGKAERLVHSAAELRVTSFRPSVIFGPEDSFFNRFASLLRLAPGIFPLACPAARFAPVFVGDVAEAFVRTLKNPAFYGRSLNLCGPETFTLEELVRYTAECTGVRRLIIPLPDLLSRIQAAAFDAGGFLFNLLNIEKPFSTDNYLSMKQDSVCDTGDLETLGIRPSVIAAVVPQYLSPATQTSRYHRYRQHSGRFQ